MTISAKAEFDEAVSVLGISADDLDDWGDYEVEINTGSINTPVIIRWENGAIAKYDRSCGWMLV